MSAIPIARICGAKVQQNLQICKTFVRKTHFWVKKVTENRLLVRFIGSETVIN